VRPGSTFALALAGWVGVGCVSARLTDGNEVPAERVAQIRPGETTRSEILAWFGAPESFTDAGAVRRLLEESELLPAEVLDLPFADVLVFQLTELELRGLVLLVFNYVDVRSTSDRLVVFLDEQDRVTHYGYRRRLDGSD